MKNLKPLKNLLVFVNNYQQYVIPGVIIVLFYASVKLFIYTYLKSFLTILDSYLIDQLLFLAIFFVIFLASIYKKPIGIAINTLLILTAYSVFALIFQNEILNRYFVHDDVFVMFPSLIEPHVLDYSYTNKIGYYYYHFLPFSLLFKFFQFNSYYYNAFALITMGISAAVLLKLLAYLNITHKFQNKLLIIAISLGYIVSPVIADSYSYIEHGVAIGYISAAALASLYFHMVFLRDKSRTTYFVLSYTLMLFLLKTAMTRIGFWPISLVLLEILHWPKTKSERIGTLSRIILLLIPFYIMAKPYLIPSGGGRLYGIGLDRLINFDRIYLIFGSLIPTIIPYQIFEPIYKTIRIIASNNNTDIFNNFFLSNIFFTSGLIMFLLTVICVLIIYKKKGAFRNIIFFGLCSLMALSFYMFFGNVEKGERAGQFDLSIISYSLVPGSRYYPIPFVFLIITSYILVATFLSSLKGKIKTVAYYFTCLVFSLIVWSSINFTQKVNRSANTGMIIYKKIVEGVRDMAPDNSQQKVVYSTGGEIREVTFLGWDGFAGFYKYSTLKYITDKNSLLKFLKENKISSDNFYAFYFDKESSLFKDQTFEWRNKLSTYLAK